MKLRAAMRPGGVAMALGAVLVGALALRLWGIGHGLPYAYNIDEADQFVARAVAMSGSALNPHYFANPPALTYLLHALFTLRFGGHAAVQAAFQRHPAELYELARGCVALLNVAALYLQYLLTRRLFGAPAGLLAAALMAVAFLPEYYSHLALNDAATLLPLTLTLYAAAGLMQRSRSRDWLLAGLGLGLGAATKYTAGITLLAILCAAWLRYRLPAQGAARSAEQRGLELASGLAVCGAVALAAFLLANPYALIDAHAFLRELGQESAVAGEAAGKLGAAKQPAILYYLWSFTWGFGWLPALAALGGALLAIARKPRAALLLLPMAVAYLAIMGSEGRAFGRWLMPLLPVASALAAWFALELARRIAEAAGRIRAIPAAAAGGRMARALAVLFAAMLVAQGLIYDVHSDLVLSRTDTRTLMRRWMLARVPQGARIVVEPGVVGAAWLRTLPVQGRSADVPNQWDDYRLSDWLIAPAAGGGWRYVRHFPREEQYARTLTPALLDYYRQQGYCWVLSASTQYERAFSDAAAVPRAIAYYRSLRSSSQLAHAVSPLAAGAAPPAFSYDFSFDYYPLAYSRPGPRLQLYHLGGGCAPTASGTARRRPPVV